MLSPFKSVVSGLKKGCNKKCSENLRNERKHEIHDNYWSLNKDNENICILHMVETITPIWPRKKATVKRESRYASVIQWNLIALCLMAWDYQGKISIRCSQRRINFIRENFHIIHFIFWLDNCSGQTKNWYLHTTLVHEVNSENNSTKTITLKYFEHGHTFMSADSFHH